MTSKPDSCLGCPWYDISQGYAAGVGPSSAALVIVAESLGQNEVQQGIPLVGWSGQQVNRLLTNHGVKRQEVYCDNVIRCQPPASSGKTKRSEKIPKKIIQFCTERHLKPALALIKPNAILALGDYSLRFLTEKKGISKWRGSILNTSYGKVIPTYHPSWLVHGEAAHVMWPFVDFDFGRAIEESKTAEYIGTEENFNIEPSIKEIELFVEEVKSEGAVSVDIETSGGTWWTTVPLCIGMYLLKSKKAMCIPILGYRGEYVWNSEELEKVIAFVSDILSSEEIRKIFQNGVYDIQVLESIGF